MASRKSILEVIAAAVLWGCTGFFVRQLGAIGFTGLQIVCFRSLLASLLLLPVFWFGKRSLLRFRLRDIWLFFGTGICSLLFFNICYFTGMQTSLPVACALLYTSPIFLLILSVILFHEKITWTKIAALVLIFAGSILTAGLLGGNADFSMKGLLLGLGSGFGYALYSIFSRFALDRGYSTPTIIFYTFVFAGVGGLPLSLTSPLPAFTGTGILFLLSIAVLCSIFPYFLYTASLTGIDAGLAGMISSLELVVSSLVGFLLLGDPVTPQLIAGILLVLIGVVTVNADSVFRRKRRGLPTR